MRRNYTSNVKSLLRHENHIQFPSLGSWIKSSKNTHIFWFSTFWPWGWKSPTIILICRTFSINSSSWVSKFSNDDAMLVFFVSWLMYMQEHNVISVMIPLLCDPWKTVLWNQMISLVSWTSGLWLLSRFKCRQNEYS